MTADQHSVEIEAVLFCPQPAGGPDEPAARDADQPQAHGVGRDTLDKPRRLGPSLDLMPIARLGPVQRTYAADAGGMGESMNSLQASENRDVVLR